MIKKLFQENIRFQAGFGLGQLGFGGAPAPFSLIWNGAPPPRYTIYFRAGIGWSVGPLGDPVANAEDVPMYTYVEGIRQYSNYAGTNKVENNTDYLDPFWSAVDVDVSLSSVEAPKNYGFYYEIKTTTIISGQTLRFANVVEIGKTVTWHRYQKSNGNDKISLDFSDALFGTQSADFDLTAKTAIGNSGAIAVLEELADGSFKLIVTATPIASGTSQFITRMISPIAGGSFYVIGDQVTETNYALPDIPTTGTAITVSQPFVSIRAQDNGPDLAFRPWKKETLDVVPQIVDYGLEGHYNGPGSGVQEIFNGDMELETGWANKNVPVINERSSEKAHTGQYSRKIEANGAVQGMSSENFIVEINKTYEVCIFVWGDGVNRFAIKADGGTSYYYTDVVGDIFPVGWTLVAYRFTSDATVATKKIEVFSGSLATAGLIYIDDATLREVQPAVGMTIFDNFNTRQVIQPNQLSDGYTKEPGWTEAVPGTLVKSGTIDNDFYKFALRADKYQKFTYEIVEASGDGTVVIADGVEAIQSTVPKTVGVHTVWFINDGVTNTNMGMGVRGNTTGTITIEALDIKEVQTLIRPEEGPAYFYIDPDTGVLTAVDDAGNVAVFSSPLVDNTSYYKFWLSHNGDTSEMWISVEETKGTSVRGAVQTFSGAFAPIGEFLQGTDSYVYHTVRKVYWEDELAFAYVVKDGVLAVKDGKFVIRYL